MKWATRQLEQPVIVRLVAAVLAACVCLPGRGAEADDGDSTKGTPAEPAEETAEVEEALDIRAETLSMDFAKRTALFEGNVRVSDARMLLTAKKMMVFLTKDNEFERVEAVGDVVIQRAKSEEYALAGRAVYDVAKGTIVLTEDPSVIIGRHSAKEAKKITYFRATQTFTFEGGVVLRILTPKDRRTGALPPFITPAKKDDAPASPQPDAERDGEDGAKG